MGQKVAMLVNGAALDGQVVTPERHERGLQAWGAIDDHELGLFQPALIQIIEELAPCCGALAARSAGKQRPTLFSDPPHS